MMKTFLFCRPKNIQSGITPKDKEVVWQRLNLIFKTELIYLDSSSHQNFDSTQKHNPKLTH